MADFMGLMKQAAELKTKMEAMQAELDNLEIEGVSGGGLVRALLSGKGELKGLKIDETLLKPSEKEIVEDLVVAAHSDGRRKLETMLQEKMKGLTGGLPAAHQVAGATQGEVDEREPAFGVLHALAADAYARERLKDGLGCRGLPPDRARGLPVHGHYRAACEEGLLRSQGSGELLQWLPNRCRRPRGPR